MRFLLRCLLMLGCMGATHALTPLPDKSPRLFAGEWAGTGALGSYCYVQLRADGGGDVLVDAGSGDWLGARIRWRNHQQTLQVEQVLAAKFSAALRVTPLNSLTLRSEFNQSLRLIWNDPKGGCHLQRIELSAQRLSQARSTAAQLQSLGGTP
jgi:hypothetical protein